MLANLPNGSVSVFHLCASSLRIHFIAFCCHRSSSLEMEWPHFPPFAQLSCKFHFLGTTYQFLQNIRSDLGIGSIFICSTKTKPADCFVAVFFIHTSHFDLYLLNLLLPTCPMHVSVAIFCCLFFTFWLIYFQRACLWVYACHLSSSVKFLHSNPLPPLYLKADSDITFSRELDT